MTEILEDASLERQVESFLLAPSDGGRFEFSVDGILLFSKLQTQRHADAGEIKQIFMKYLADE